MTVFLGRIVMLPYAQRPKKAQLILPRVEAAIGLGWHPCVGP